MTFDTAEKNSCVERKNEDKSMTEYHWEDEKKWIDDIADWTGLKTNEVARITEDRQTPGGQH